MFDAAVAHGFLNSANRALLLEESDVERLFERLASWKPVHAPKWIRSSDL
jgi:hypothetical protein